MSAPLQLDPVIHAPTRLRIMATLAAIRPDAALKFPRLQELLDLTPGNLITHLRKLEEAGYVESTTMRDGGAKSTELALTDVGRAAYGKYRDTLRDWLQ